MAKNVALADDVYDMLSKERKEGESFSDVIRRWRRKKGSLLDVAGAWADIPEKEWREIEAAIYGADRPAAPRGGRGPRPPRRLGRGNRPRVRR